MPAVVVTRGHAVGASDWVLLTGATGFLGRWLLRELLAARHRVAILVRGAEERVGELVAGWGDELPADFVRPAVISGDLCSAGLGLSAVDRAWLSRRCRRVIHAAADVSFHGKGCRATNVDGTARLLELAVGNLHYVSTAFICGHRTDPVYEDEFDTGQQFHNEYEHSKFEGERFARAAGATVYRPSVIVGDSRTGATCSYHGLYQFLQAAQRLAVHTPAARLPFSGDERHNLVPVDWVARAIVCLFDRPAWHGRTFHLVAPVPVPVRVIKEAADELLGTARLRLVGPGASPADALFLRLVADYLPYLRGDPAFDCRNTLAALPNLPAPAVDRAMLKRVIRFALNDDWGRRAADAKRVDCADYIERFLPRAAHRSVMRDLPLDATVGLNIADAGNWSCRWAGGELVEVQRGSCRAADVVFRTDLATFSAVVRNRLSPQDAFLTRRLEIDGDVERGLKLAVLFAQLVREFPYDLSPTEATDGVACAG